MANIQIPLLIAVLDVEKQGLLSYDVAVMQVHVRTKPCYKDDVACNCAVAMREGNNILGVYACDPDSPPVAIRYLVDPTVPGADITVTSNGKTYTVRKKTPILFVLTYFQSLPEALTDYIKAFTKT